MPDIDEKYGKRWSRQELILALYVYCKIPFSHCHARNDEVRQLAAILGRTPSSVARKLGNLGSFDPTLAAKGIKGLIHTSKADRDVWDTYHGRWSQLVADVSAVLVESGLGSKTIKKFTHEEQEPVFEKPIGPTAEYQIIMARRCQSFFRRAVLSSYQCSCCICGLDLRSLLIASHIVPWSVNENLRADPQNGLCLCSLHDKAFDSGLLSVDEGLAIHLSRLIKRSQNVRIGAFFLEFEGRRILLPNRFSPNPTYLDWHFSNRFTP